MDEQLFNTILKEKFGQYVLDHYPWPKAFPDNPSGICAIVLGADPSHKARKGKPWKPLEFVFSLEDGVHNPYFKRINDNLNVLGLSIGTVYVQNVCRNYFNADTFENSHDWKQAADLWIPHLKEELDIIVPNLSVPVLMTTEIIYRVLLNDDVEAVKAEVLYSDLGKVPIKPSFNRLGRPLIPMFRHRKYDFDIDKSIWNLYVRHVRNILKDN